MSTLILAVSTILQFGAAFLALRLVRITQHRAAWLLLATAILLMAVRRSITLYRLLSGDLALPPDPAAETVALFISILMILGVARIAPVFVELKNSAREIQKSQRQLQAILDNSAARIYAKDLEGRYLFTNKQNARLMRRSVGDILGKTDEELMSKESADKVRANDARVVEECHAMEFDEELPHPDGTLHHYLCVKFPLLDGDGKAYAACGIATDITDRLKVEAERRQFEAKLQHAQKLESLGVLAGGIAHDFNNLLVAILGSADLALSHPRLDPEIHDDLKHIEVASETAAALCRQLLVYSGRGQLNVTAVDLTELVSKMITLLKVSVSKKARLVTSFDETLPLIEADEAQLQQVIMNLMTNASDALGDGNGTIEVSTSYARVDEAGLADQRAGETLLPGDYACLEVKDDGSGMDEETQRRLFEPFFTTKFTGRGLGLAAVAGIVRSHGGAITLTSSPGEGTTFRVLFPLADATRRVNRSDSGIPGRIVEGSTVLVVDDEAMVRRVARKALERAGFRVLMAENGEMAAEVFALHRDEIAVVLLDMTMPELDGAQTFERLRSIDPNVRVILATGYDESAASRQGFSEQLAGFLQKPFSARRLTAAVREVLLDRPTAGKAERVEA